MRGGKNIGKLLYAYENNQIQKCPKYKISSNQNVQQHPPPTAQMRGSNLLIFWREAPQGYLLRGIGKIFKFLEIWGFKARIQGYFLTPGLS